MKKDEYKWIERLLSNDCRPLGPLHFGMLPENAIELFGLPESESGDSKGTVVVVLTYPGFELHFGRSGLWGEIGLCRVHVYQDGKGELRICFEPALYNALAPLCGQANGDSEAYSQLFAHGYRRLSEFRAGGMSRENAYNTLVRLNMDCNLAQGDLERYGSDLACEWMDCLWGWIGKESFRL